jgi:hypothetical protein
MSDKLKDFIKAHRDEFDHRDPSDRVWDGIEKDLLDRDRRGVKAIWSSVSIWRAAAVIFFGLSVYLFVANKPRMAMKTTSSHRMYRNSMLCMKFFGKR